jgi:hypothetical protein
MSNNNVPPTQVHPGGHYSGKNPIPNVKKFIESLDKEKKERDAKIDADSKARKDVGGSDVMDHTEGQPVGVKGTQKTVTDPTTGGQVQIEDVNADFMKAVDEPMLSVPNANVSYVLFVKFYHLWELIEHLKEMC